VEIEYIEEPCRSLDDSARLSQERRLPVAFDETLSEIEPSVLGQYSGLAAIVLKPTLLGGFENCAARARTARDIGAKVVMSSSFESSVGLAALASFAAAYGSPETAMGLDTLRWLQSDVTAEPIAIHDGRILIEQAARAVENINLSMLTQVFDV
jgi:O-succinylbenzoate synthase